MQLNQGFSHSSLLMFGWEDFMLLEGFLVHWRVFSSIPDLYPLDANSSGIVVTTNVSRPCMSWGGGQNHPAGTTDLDAKSNQHLNPLLALHTFLLYKTVAHRLYERTS